MTLDGHFTDVAPQALQNAILRSTDTSPFGRKVRIALAILGWSDIVSVVPGSPIDLNDPLLTDNPLGKMPCLVLADGRSIYDSPVILEFLDILSDGKLIPRPFGNRMSALRNEALSDGLTDAAMLIGSERMFHAPEQVSDRWTDHQLAKVNRALTAFETSLPELGRVDVGAIGLAAALGYLDWRKPLAWRETFPSLVRWLDAFRDVVPAYDDTCAGY